ncbi:porin [Pontibacter sp. H249]|uniref:porin n=1 Tax=Pontibacter sp. H249 TaxID=3133420 RepID=UPI0030BA3729
MVIIKKSGIAALATAILSLGAFTYAKAQTDTTITQTVIPTVAPAPLEVKHTDAAKKKAWYEILSIRGYAQIRYNRLLETNPDLKCDQCDKSIGENGGLFIRRARLIFSGNVHDRVFIYIQPDLASSPSSSTLNFLQLRDAYFDVSLDAAKEYRVRIGQSKIPYGFENLQSSSNRIPLDRNDAINSAIANERDLGVFFYYAPAKIRSRFEELTSLGLKGSGDYGVLGLGIYNGQTANKPEANDNLHAVARVSYPFKLMNGQFIEPGIQAYTGKYTVTPDQVSSGVSLGDETNISEGFTDQRIAATLVVYPQPFGIQAEYNVGRGPEYDPESNSIMVKPLHGGYVQAMYRKEVGNQVVMPFVRVQHYEGGKKHERDAASHTVYETEIGAEWLLFKNLELTALYSIGDRTVRNASNPLNRQHGNRLRLQAQFNF